ncbi:MAG: hypothetical protein U0V54_15465 [Saprospiraceae bacterium]
MNEDYIYLTDRASVEWNERDVKSRAKHFVEALALAVFPKGRY